MMMNKKRLKHLAGINESSKAEQSSEERISELEDAIRHAMDVADMISGCTDTWNTEEALERCAHIGQELYSHLHDVLRK